jgi:lytic cellulose monooxygenase (C1-hydroxylating)
MVQMYFFKLCLTLMAFSCCVQAHTVLVEFDGDESCLRPHPLVDKNSPVVNPNSPERECNHNGFSVVKKSCVREAGSVVKLRWQHDVDTKGPLADDNIIEQYHKGACSFYIADKNGGDHLKWFKIYAYGYENEMWCNQYLRKNFGELSFTLPIELAPGSYLLRTEVIAMHLGFQPYRMFLF